MIRYAAAEDNALLAELGALTFQDTFGMDNTPENLSAYCDIVWLAVWERNHRAIAFYRKWGFVEVGNQSFLLGDDLQNDLVMQRIVKI